MRCLGQTACQGHTATARTRTRSLTALLNTSKLCQQHGLLRSDGFLEVLAAQPSTTGNGEQGCGGVPQGIERATTVSFAPPWPCSPPHPSSHAAVRGCQQGNMYRQHFTRPTQRTQPQPHGRNTPQPPITARPTATGQARSPPRPANAVATPHSAAASAPNAVAASTGGDAAAAR